MFEAPARNDNFSTVLIGMLCCAAFGLAISGAVSWLVLQTAFVKNANGAIIGLTSFGQFIFAGAGVGLAIPIVSLLIALGLVFLICIVIRNRQWGKAAAILFLIAALLGAGLSLLVLVYTFASVTNMFLISAAAVGALCLWALIAPQSISTISSFLFMAIIGVVIAVVVNMQTMGSALQFVISIVGVLVFSSLTAFCIYWAKQKYDVSGISRSVLTTAGGGEIASQSLIHQSGGIEMSNGVIIGLGITALVCALLAIIVPIYGFWISGLAIIFAVVTALAGDRVFSIVTPIVAGINSYFLSPSLWLMFHSVSDRGTMVAVFLVFLVAPFVAIALNTSGIFAIRRTVQAAAVGPTAKGVSFTHSRAI